MTDVEQILKENEEHKARDLIRKAEKVADVLIKSNASSDERITKSLSDALRDVFGEKTASGRFIDVTRIPLICQSILVTQKRLDSIEGNLSWAVKIVVGAVILALIGLVITNVK